MISISSASGYADPTRAPGEGGWGLGYGMSKAAFHRVAGQLATELEPTGVRFFNVQPELHRHRADRRRHGRVRDRERGRAGDVVAAVVIWLVTDPEAAEWNWRNIEAQFFCHERNLLPGWAGPIPNELSIRYDVGARCSKTLRPPCGPGSASPSRPRQRISRALPAWRRVTGSAGLCRRGAGDRISRRGAACQTGRDRYCGVARSDSGRVDPDRSSRRQRAIGCFTGASDCRSDPWMEHRTDPLFRGDLELPRIAGLLRHAGRHLVEATLAPLAPLLPVSVAGRGSGAPSSPPWRGRTERSPGG